MDWIVVGTTVFAGWIMLSVLSGERLTQAQRLAIRLANAAAEQARLARENERLATASNEPILAESPPPLNRTR